MQKQRSTYKIWVRNPSGSLPPDAFDGIRLLEETWLGADVVRLSVSGDGADLESRIRTRKDLFSVYEKNPDGY